jgi:hypothetical protein
MMRRSTYPPPLVGREDAVGHQHRRRAGVIGEHPERRVLDGHLPRVRAPGDRRDLLQDRGKEVRVEVVVGALQDRGQPLEPHPRVHGGPRQRGHLPRRVALELHEDEVPDLQRGVPRTVHEVRGVLREVGPGEVVDLRAGPQGPVSPIAQKFSLSPKRRILAFGRYRSQSFAASSSSVKTVAQSRSGRGRSPFPCRSGAPRRSGSPRP